MKKKFSASGSCVDLLIIVLTLRLNIKVKTYRFSFAFVSYGCQSWPQ